MKNFLTVFLLLFTFCAPAAVTNRITATITITNVPTMVPTNTITINSKTITWTNAVGGAPSTLVLTNTTVNTSATNLYNQFTSYPLTSITPRWLNTNAIDLVGNVDLAMVLTRGGDWCSITYSTQVVTLALTVRVAIDAEPNAAVRQFIASELVQGISDLSTSAVAMAATAMTNFVGRTNQQTIGQKFITNSTFLSPVTTNLTNYGSALV